MSEDRIGLGGALCVVVLIALIGGCKFKFWRWEHPQAPTWTFFIGRH